MARVAAGQQPVRARASVAQGEFGGGGTGNASGADAGHAVAEAGRPGQPRVAAPPAAPLGPRRRELRHQHRQLLHPALLLIEIVLDAHDPRAGAVERNPQPKGQ